MVNVYVLKSLDQVRALADTLRISILNLLCQQAMTTKQVSTALALPVHKLYHHVETLEQAGLIKLTQTKPNRGTLEKYFQSVARHFTLSPTLFEVKLDTKPDTQNEITVSAVLQKTLDEIKASLASDMLKASSNFLSSLHIHLDETRAALLHQKLQQWLDECRNNDSATATTIYSIVTAFYPLAENNPNLPEQ